MVTLGVSGRITLLWTHRGVGVTYRPYGQPRGEGRRRPFRAEGLSVCGNSWGRLSRFGVPTPKGFGPPCVAHHRSSRSPQGKMTPVQIGLSRPGAQTLWARLAGGRRCEVLFPIWRCSRRLRPANRTHVLSRSQVKTFQLGRFSAYVRGDLLSSSPPGGSMIRQRRAVGPATTVYWSPFPLSGTL